MHNSSDTPRLSVKVIHILTGVVRSPTQRGAALLAQALGGVLLGALCLACTADPALARDGLSTQTLAKRYISNNSEYNCFNYIITQESHWNTQARNPRSTAYGIGQLLTEHSKDRFIQILHAVAYGIHRYGTLCNARQFHLQHRYW